MEYVYINVHKRICFVFILRHRNDESKYQTLPVKPKRIPSNKRLPSDERPSKRLKWTSQQYPPGSLPPGSHPGPPPAPLPPTSYFTLPHRNKSQKVAKTASFHFSSPFSSKQHANLAPAAPASEPPTSLPKSLDQTKNTRETAPPPQPVKRENSLTSKLQDQSMGIHKLIFDRLNNNSEDYSENSAASVQNGGKSKCAKCLKTKQWCRHRLLSLEEQRKLVKFRRFLSASNIANKSEFLSRIEAIRRRQKREARRSIVDEHGMPPDYTQSR